MKEPAETVPMIKNTVDLKPFRVPNYVIQEVPPGRRQDGFKEAPKYHLSELSDDVLAALCDQFRLDVMAKAKSLPREGSSE